MTAVARARGVSLAISHRSAGVEIARSITHPSAQASVTVGRNHNQPWSRSPPDQWNSHTTGQTTNMWLR